MNKHPISQVQKVCESWVQKYTALQRVETHTLERTPIFKQVQSLQGPFTSRMCHFGFNIVELKIMRQHYELFERKSQVVRT